MFKRWYKTWKKRRNCDHAWHKVGSYFGGESGNLYLKQYCPLCGKERDKLEMAWEREQEIERVKRMYKD